MSSAELIFFVIFFSVKRIATSKLCHEQGWDDVGFHGSEISTPNIDALAYSGIILNKYYVSPICSPTRSAIMTGRHPIHTGKCMLLGFLQKTAQGFKL